MAKAFAFLKLTNRLACQGVQAVYGRLDAGELDSASDIQAIEEQESFSFAYSRVDDTGSVRPITAQLRAGRVVSPVYDDGSFTEWRLGTITDGRGEKGLITVQCVPLWLDLVERSDSMGGKGWVSDVVSGTRNFQYEITERDAASIWASDVIPNCPAWVTAGTIEPTYVIPTLSISRQTPGAVALAVRDALRAVDVVCEVRLRRNGTTGYQLDLVTQIGASAPTPVFHPDTALLALQRKTDPTLQATRVLPRGGTAPDGLPGQWGGARWRGGAPAGLVVALTDRNGGASPIAFDGQFVGMSLLRVKTGRTFPITASAAATGSVTLASVSDIAADEDFEFRVDEPGTNTRTTSTRYAISAVPDGTHLTMAVSVPITGDGQYTDWYARAWDSASGGAIVATTRIAGSVAATDVITVASSASITTAHFVEFIQLDGAGEIPCFVDHPTYSQPDPVGYGVKVAELARQAIGVTQITPNPWMRTWSNPANPPDGWILGGTGGGLAGSRENTITQKGGYSWHFLCGATNHPAPQTPTVYPNSTDGSNRLSCRASVYLKTFNFSFGGGLRLEVRAMKGDGTIGAILGSVTALPVGGAAGFTQLSAGAFVDLTIDGIQLLPNGDPATDSVSPFGVCGILYPQGSVSGTSDPFEIYLDSIEFYQFAACPSDPYEFGDASALAQSANNQLRLVASPPIFYRVNILDLARAFPAEFPRLEPTLGGNVRVVDVEYGTDATVRLLQMRRNLLNPAQTELTLDNRPARFTSVVSASTARQNRIASAVIAGADASQSSATSFVPLTTAITLTPNAQISTPLASAPTVVLPTPAAPAPGEQPSGSSVTYVPVNPATTPTTTVTVGTPPSRRKPLTPF